jgi:hypothetical protein
MIRYPITSAELEAAIEQEKCGWLAKAKNKTATFRAAKNFNEPDGKNSWGEIKPVFMRLQHNKCAFCDRLLSAGRIEHDVEHFRPKNAVKAWPAKSKELQPDYRFSTGEAADNGYYLLAYNIFNYATSCKMCNTTLKGNYFPVASQRVMDSDDFEKLKLEHSYLIYPLGDLDDDPEDLITYRGILPIPKYRRGHKHRRARVTIDLFALDIREDLLRLRAEIIQTIWLAFITISTRNVNNENTQLARQIIDRARSPRTSQTACARVFYDLCQNDAINARRFAQEADDFLSTIRVE